jgi:ABC-type phosphate transport system permease subunit
LIVVSFVVSVLASVAVVPLSSSIALVVASVPPSFVRVILSALM